MLAGYFSIRNANLYYKKEGRKELLREYCKQYTEGTSKNPNLTHEINAKKIKKILKELDTDAI